MRILIFFLTVLLVISCTVESSNQEKSSISSASSSSQDALYINPELWKNRDSAHWQIQGGSITNQLLKDGDSAILGWSCEDCNRIEFKCDQKYNGELRFSMDGRLIAKYGPYDCKSNKESFVVPVGKHHFKWALTSKNGDHAQIVSLSNLSTSKTSEFRFGNETLFEDGIFPDDLKSNLLMSNGNPFQGSYSLGSGYFSDGEEQYVEIPVDGTTRAEVFIKIQGNSNSIRYLVDGIDHEYVINNVPFTGDLWRQAILFYPLGAKKLRLSYLTKNGDQFSSINVDNIRTKKLIATTADTIGFEDGLVEWAQQIGWYQDNAIAYQGEMALHSRTVGIGETLALQLPEKEFSKFQFWIRNFSGLDYGLWVDGIKDTSKGVFTGTNGYYQNTVQRSLGIHKLELRVWGKYGSSQAYIDQLRWSKD